MNRGEIWWAVDPEAGRRPFLVLARETAVPVLNRVIAVPATRTVRDLPTEVSLGPEDGMPSECVLAVDNITAIRKERLTEPITRLGPERMAQVCAALAIATGCA